MSPALQSIPPGDNAPALIDNPVISTPEVSKLTGLSGRTLQRLAEDGSGPPRIHLTERRVAYWRNDVPDWLRSRTTARKGIAA